LIALIWTIELIKPAHFVKVTAQGDFTLADCRAMKEDILARDYWQPSMNVLIDYRGTSFTNLNLDVLREVGAFHQTVNEQLGSGRMALLMRSPHDFGLARQYEMITEGKVLSHIRVFLDENKALEWLTETSSAI